MKPGTVIMLALLLIAILGAGALQLFFLTR
jgi:hypothetical protein